MKKILFTLATASLMLIGSAFANQSEISRANNADIEKLRNKNVAYPAIFWS